MSNEELKQLTEMITMYESGESTVRIGAHFGIHSSSVQRKLKSVGVEMRPAGFRKGSDHHAWKDGLIKSSTGYVMRLVYEDDPFFKMGQVKADGLRYVLEHRYVMAKHLGRPLRKEETVHHIDGDKMNNDLSNLQLRHGRHGKGTAFCCADCGSHNIVPVAIVG